MDYLDLNIVELHKLLVNKEVTPLELTKLALEKAKKDTNNAFETICEKEAIEFASTLTEPEEDNVFWGIPYVSKDNFSTKDILTTASSNILNDYIPVFDATVIKKLKDAKAILIGKTTLDELAMGGTGTTGHKGITYNPYDKSHTYMIGGSSCGSACAVASGIVPFALGSDTGDSVRKPASYAGLVGMKPTWGRISRFGLFPFAPSLDHVGYFTRSIKDACYALELLAGRDNHDSTSSTKEVPHYIDNINGNLEGKKICVLKEIFDNITDNNVSSKFLETISYLQKAGAQVDFVDFGEALLYAILPTYMVISCAEATSNNANLDGIKFGPRIGGETTYQEVMMKARTQGFSELIKRRFVIGSYSLFKENQEELFLKAQKARRAIVNRTNELLEIYDAIYLPCVSETKKKLEGASQDKLSASNMIVENHLAIGNFSGLPSISLPIGLENNFPFDANLTGRAFDEANLLNIAYSIEQRTNLKDLVVEKVVD